MTQTTANTTPGFDAAAFEAFWSKPDPAAISPDLFTPDVVGHWPDGDLHGVDEYTARLKKLLALLPDLRLEVVEHADNGEYIFVQWRMHATGRNGRFDVPGVDRIRVKDGLVAENLIIFDTRRFEEQSGYSVAEL